MRDVLVSMVITVAIIAGIAAILAGFDRWVNSASCAAVGAKMQIKTDYSLLTGCMIDINGQWLPWGEVVPVTRNGKIVFEPRPQVRIGQ